jgi:protein-tyrosine-phosphatase
VVTVMAEVGIDLANRTPRAIAPAELEEVDLVITIGCSAEEVCPAT